MRQPIVLLGPFVALGVGAAILAEVNVGIGVLVSVAAFYAFTRIVKKK